MSLNRASKRLETLLVATKPGSDATDSKLLALAFGFDYKLMTTPPVDIRRLALSLKNPKVSSIRSAKLPVDGMLVPGKGGVTILVNGNHSVARQRFSCAHELVHAIRSPELPAQRQLSFPSTKPSERERQCERLASVLLMPNPAFRDCVDRFGHSINTVLKLHRIFQTSIQATAIRFVDVIKEHCILVVSGMSGGKSGRRLRVKWSSQNGDRLSDIGHRFIPRNASLDLQGALTAYSTPGTQPGREVFSIGRRNLAGFTESRGFGYGNRRYVLTMIYPDRPYSESELYQVQGALE